MLTLILLVELPIRTPGWRAWHRSAPREEMDPHETSHCFPSEQPSHSSELYGCFENTFFILLCVQVNFFDHTKLIFDCAFDLLVYVDETRNTNAFRLHDVESSSHPCVDTGFICTRVLLITSIQIGGAAHHPPVLHGTSGGPHAEIKHFASLVNGAPGILRIHLHLYIPSLFLCFAIVLYACKKGQRRVVSALKRWCGMFNQNTSNQRHVYVCALHNTAKSTRS